MATTSEPMAFTLGAAAAVPTLHTHTPTTAIAVHDLTVAYREKPVLWDIDLTVPAGVLMAVVGPNGAGKTTLIKAMLGLVKPVSGEVLVHGKPYSPRAQTVAYVPQRGTVDWDFPTTVFDVALMGTYGRLGWFRRPGAAERTATADALARVGMSDFAEPANQPAIRRATAARFPRSRTCARRTCLPHGRTVSGRGRSD